MSTYDALAKVAPEKLTNKFFMFKVSTDVEFETSSNIKDLSAEYGQDDAKFGGEESLIISRYQAFAEYLSKHQNINVLLNHVVNKVTSTGETSSTVSCSNGKTFTADKVVIAVPLGVLKKNAITFSPALPDWKAEAISKLRMGNVCKVLIVPKKNLNILNTEQYIGVVSDDIEKRGAATYFVNIAALASVPAYMTFGLGPNSDEIENMPEADLKTLIA
jgi:monoamine oxidase